MICLPSLPHKRFGKIQDIFFSAKQQKELLFYILTLEEGLFGITLSDLLVLAFQLAENNDTYSVLAKYLELSFRNPKLTSLARAKGYNRSVVGNSFTLIQSTYDTYNCSPYDIYNVNETHILQFSINRPKYCL